MKHDDTRSPLARAAGLGSAGTGVGHWWAQRVSAVALIPLTLWFVVSMIRAGGEYTRFVEWLGNPFVAMAMVLLLIAAFHHMALGLQVIVEDYVHSAGKFAILLLVRLACIGLAVAGVVATLYIALRDQLPG